MAIQPPKHSGEHIVPRSEEALWTQRYCTDDSPDTVGFIDCVPDPAGIGPSYFVVRVKQGAVRCDSQGEAEIWLQKHVLHERRVRDGVKLVRS